MKFFVVSSSGKMRNMADFSEPNFSASMALPKQSTCSSSESRNALRRESTVNMAEAMACSALLSAAPANHLALWSGGSLPTRSWK